jgi:LPS-assembly protein
LGEVLYFADRQVQLAGAAEEQGGSAMAGELDARLTSDWSGRASLLWDPYRGSSQLRKGTLGIHYRNPQRQLVNLSYRLNETDRTDDTTFEDTELSFRWPVNPRLELVGRWLYSLRYDQTMEAFGGLEYGSCCWRVRALVRNFVSSADQEPNLSFMLQLELTGLGAFGNGIEEFLERGIYGYEVE